jgi:hypothetical protein
VTDLSSPTTAPPGDATVAPAAPRSAAPAHAATAAAAAAVIATAPPAAVPDLGRVRHPYGVLLRARGRGGVYDIVVYQDALVLARATGTDPAVIGTLVGAVFASVVGALVGALIGEWIARNAAAKRVHDLCYATPEYVFGADRRNHFIRPANVRYARLIKYGRRQRVLELKLRDGSRRCLSFDDRLQSNSFAVQTLRISLGPRLRVERQRLRASTIVMGVLIAVAGLISTALLAHFFIA